MIARQVQQTLYIHKDRPTNRKKMSGLIFSLSGCKPVCAIDVPLAWQSTSTTVIQHAACEHSSKSFSKAFYKCLQTCGGGGPGGSSPAFCTSPNPLFHGGNYSNDVIFLPNDFVKCPSGASRTSKKCHIFYEREFSHPYSHPAQVHKRHIFWQFEIGWCYKCSSNIWIQIPF